MNGRAMHNDSLRRCCRHCGNHRRIKDSRPRLFAIGLEQISVKVPRQRSMRQPTVLGALRSLITSVAPRVAPKILDWLHRGMKPRALKSPLHARTSLLFERPALTTTETSKGSDARELDQKGTTDSRPMRGASERRIRGA
jgi:hypothetical protein